MKEVLFLMRGSYHLDRPSNVEIGDEYQIIFDDVFFNCCCEMHFRAPSRSIEGWVISLQKLQSNLSFFSIQPNVKK